MVKEDRIRFSCPFVYFVGKNSVLVTIHSLPQKSQEGTKRNGMPDLISVMISAHQWLKQFDPLFVYFVCFVVKNGSFRLQLKLAWWRSRRRHVTTASDPHP